MTIVPSVSRSSKTPISALSVCWTRASSGTTPSGSTETTTVGVLLLESDTEVGAGRTHVTRRDQPSPDRQQMRCESHGKPQKRGDLRRVPVLAHVVRDDVLENRPRM